MGNTSTIIFTLETLEHRKELRLEIDGKNKWYVYGKKDGNLLSKTTVSVNTRQGYYPDFPGQTICRFKGKILDCKIDVCDYNSNLYKVSYNCGFSIVEPKDIIRYDISTTNELNGFQLVIYVVKIDPFTPSW